jgi:hypothetical protein
MVLVYPLSFRSSQVTSFPRPVRQCQISKTVFFSSSQTTFSDFVDNPVSLQLYMTFPIFPWFSECLWWRSVMNLRDGVKNRILRCLWLLWLLSLETVFRLWTWLEKVSVQTVPNNKFLKGTPFKKTKKEKNYKKYTRYRSWAFLLLGCSSVSLSLSLSLSRSRSLNLILHPGTNLPLPHSLRLYRGRQTRPRVIMKV